MEFNQAVLNLQDTSKEMLAVLGVEVTGYELEKARICDIYCPTVLSYAPAVVIRARNNEDVKNLVYSPLSAQMFLTDDEIEDLSTIGKSYQNGCLSAAVVEKEGTVTLELKVEEKDIICANIEKAQNLLTGFLAISYESNVRIAYYKAPLEHRELKPAIAAGILSWCLRIKRRPNWFENVIINVACSHVYSIGLPMREYAEIKQARRCQTLDRSGNPSQTYFWNGKSFIPCADESIYLTTSEAKEVCKNLSENISENDEWVISDLPCPVFLEETLYYAVGSGSENQILLLNAATGQISESRQQDSYYPLCDEVCYPTGNLPGAKCTQDGWNSSRAAFTQKAAGF